MVETWASEPLRDHVGRSEEALATPCPELLAGLAALLEADCPLGAGAPVPPGWHWACFPEAAPQGALGPDGHAARGTFLPALPGRRRMWAGCRLAFEGRLRIGEELRRRSEILAVEPKAGRRGPFVLVRIGHRITAPGGAAIVEEQDLVFREPAGGGDATAAAEQEADAAPPAFVRSVLAEPVLLFRFSAATFNAHRIHYDHPYATGTEGYPGLVVHGPLQAVLMLDLLRRFAPEREILRFACRMERPVFAPATLTVSGRETADGFDLRVDSAGRTVARGRAEGTPDVARAT